MLWGNTFLYLLFASIFGDIVPDDILKFLLYFHPSLHFSGMRRGFKTLPFHFSSQRTAYSSQMTPTPSSAEPATKRLRTMAVTTDVLENLSKLQSGLNKMISAKWMEERNPDDWALAVTLEAAELIDSYPWKWWKNVKGQVDMNNVKIELVDILHFTLSGQMMVGSVEKNPEAEIISPLSDTQNAIKTFRNVIALTNTHSFATITRLTIEAADDLQFNIVSYYIAKHTLNYIRQLGGYKDGTYVKENKGIEDNELLHQCIEGITLKQISANFAEVSNGIMSRVYDAFQIDAAPRRDVAHWMQ